MKKAKHFSKGKPKWDLLPLEASEEDIKILQYGLDKYGHSNWVKGTDYTEFWNSAIRHLVAWRKGEDIDKESGLPHLAHARVNIMFLIMYQLWGFDEKFDDRIKVKVQ